MSQIPDFSQGATSTPKSSKQTKITSFFQSTPIKLATSTPKSSKQTKITSFFQSTPIKLATSKTNLQKCNKLVQTESKCECDYYDSDTVEMFSSEKQDLSFYQRSCEDLKPIVEELENRQYILSQQVDSYKEKTESLCEESLELMNKFENIKDLLDDSKNNHVGVEPEVDRAPDSPVSKSSEAPQLIPTTINYDSDESNTADEIVEEIRKEIGFKNFDEQFPQCNSNTKKVDAVDKKFENSNTKNFSKDENKQNCESVVSTRSMYAQVSLCCTCDWNDDDHVRFMTSSSCEFSSMHSFNKLRMKQYESSETIPFLEESLHDCKEKYNVMSETHKSLLEDVNAAIKFENQVLDKETGDHETDKKN